MFMQTHIKQKHQHLPKSSKPQETTGFKGSNLLKKKKKTCFIFFLDDFGSLSERVSLHPRLNCGKYILWEVSLRKNPSETLNGTDALTYFCPLNYPDVGE